MTSAAALGHSRTIDAGPYEIRISAGLRSEFASSIAVVAPAHCYAVITDDQVGPLHASSLMSDLATHGRTSLHVMPAGEPHKTRDTWARLTDELLAAGCGRDTTVVALGGGVVGDLAGFVAATFMRGVPFVQCPTSLLAMIDASVGGKTGVDTSAGKNLVGAFHNPAVVLVDVELLMTLPIEHRRAGLAEAIKHGVITDARHFAELSDSLPSLLAGDPSTTLDAVARSVEIKSAVVKADVREHGLRKTLNFGHTIGHAIEHASGYGLLHGECVAIGMVLEARLAERLGIAEEGTADRIERVLDRAQLPVERPESLSAEQIVAATRLDKKARSGTTEYALPARIGEMANAETGWCIAVADAAVLEVLA
ncbi:MAG: 3-dehydroquinate synthase [Gemmatimonadaceae bacterium]